MANTVISLTVSNPSLVRLTARSYTDRYTNLPNRNMPSDMFDGLSEVYAALGGGTLEADDNTLLISAQDGEFQRLYAPKLYRKAEGQEPGFLIRWGKVEIDLGPDLKPVSAPAGTKVKLSFTRCDFSSRGLDPALSILLVRGKDTIKTVISVASVVSYKEFDPEFLNAMIESENYEDLLIQIGTQPTGKAKLPLISLESTITQAYEAKRLVADTLSVPCLGYTRLSTDGGARITYKLLCAPINDAVINEYCPETTSNFYVWSNQSVNILLEASPEHSLASVENPATIMVRKGSRRLTLIVKQGETVEGQVSLDF